ncbi:MAG: iron-containing alcohol dehydrogenase [Eubacteriales bacterium]|nr:iron-containing alcohol dehydrogenase [Eubacteriales bacterium]
MNQFIVPRKIFYGYGSLNNVTALTDERAVIVTDANMVSLGWQKKGSEILKKQNIEYTVFSEIEQNPSRSTVDKGARIVNEFKPDLIISLGGGSVIDVGKALFVFYELPELTWDEAIIPFSLPPLRKKAHFIAIPSTSGTGTEMTKAAVITNDSLPTHVKKPILSVDLVPDIAILDPELCLTIPPAVTADTGLDVLSHGLEAYVSKPANNFSDPLALEAIKIVFECLPQAYDDGSNKIVREKMHLASGIAGMAFANAGLGIMHALAHQLGAVFGISHGRSNALVMTNVIRFNFDAAKERYMKISRAIGVEGASDSDMLEGLIQKINQLISRVNVPRALKDAGLDREEFMGKLEVISKNAMNDGMLRGNPREASLDDVKKLYQEAWEK